MGADSWAICPQCVIIAEKKKEHLLERVRASYGDVSEDEYIALKEKSEQVVEPEHSLREDYEIGIYEDGKFFVSYEGSCKNCDLSYSFEHKQRLI